MDPTHLPPGLLDAIKSLPLYILGAMLLWRAYKAFGVVLAKLRSTVLQSEREAATHDHVHGVDGKGAPAHVPFDPAQQGLIAQIAQLKDAQHATARELELHRKKLRLPDPNDEQEVLAHLAEHVSTGNWPAIEEHRARARQPERPQEAPAHRDRPDGRHRGDVE